jgi:hypothetical protein
VSGVVRPCSAVNGWSRPIRAQRPGSLGGKTSADGWVGGAGYLPRVDENHPRPLRPKRGGSGSSRWFDDRRVVSTSWFVPACVTV